MGDIPNALPPLGLPAPPGVPPLRAMRAPHYMAPIPVDRGKEVAYENLVPGRHYYLQRNEAGPMDEFEFLERIPQHHSLRARYRPALRTFRNRQGNPMAPVYEPGPPGPLRNAPYEMHIWPHYRFYEINKIKRTGRFLDPTITRRAKQQAVINSLAHRGLPSGIGTGPVNTILNYAGLRPPKKTRGGKRRGNKKTRKQYGGAQASRLIQNVTAATRQTQRNPFGNTFYATSATLDEGYVMMIGERFIPEDPEGRAEEIKRERSAAKFPYEECVFFLKFTLPEEYPAVPPKILHLTPQLINYRYHPNLYGYGRFIAGHGTDGKVCLEVLGTMEGRRSTWENTITLWNVLQKLKLLFQDNPGTMEPGLGHLRDTNREGILYNRHTMFESMRVTSMIYAKVVGALEGDSTRANLRFKQQEASALEDFIKPFKDYLALRAYSALTFLIQKINLFIEANGGYSELHLPTVPDHMDNHHLEKDADFELLRLEMEETRSLIPAGLRIDPLRAPASNAQRANYNAARARGNTRTMNEFLTASEEMDLIQRRDLAIQARWMRNEREVNQYNQQNLIQPPGMNDFNQQNLFAFNNHSNQNNNESNINSFNNLQ